MIGKYRAFALAMAALAFVISFWYFGDPLAGVLAALIALVLQLIVFALVIQQPTDGNKN